MQDQFRQCVDAFVQLHHFVGACEGMKDNEQFLDFGVIYVMNDTPHPNQIE
jgi:hypothetical protein